MANIQVLPGPENYYVGGDFTEGSIANSMVETEVLDYIIPADTVLHGIHVETFVRFYNGAATTQYSRFRIKAGTDGAEVTYISPAIYATAFHITYVWLKATIDDLDWTQAQSVSITAQNSMAAGTVVSFGHMLIINGW